MLHSRCLWISRAQGNSSEFHRQPALQLKTARESAFHFASAVFFLRFCLWGHIRLMHFSKQYISPTYIYSQKANDSYQVRAINPELHQSDFILMPSCIDFALSITRFCDSWEPLHSENLSNHLSAVTPTPCLQFLEPSLPFCRR